MKKSYVLILPAIFSLALSVSAQDMTVISKDAEVSALSWEQLSIDLGTIPQNEPAEVEFNFTNKSLQPVVITDVKTTCGCTAAKHSQEPIKPGESSKITVSYNAKSVGAFNKTVTVTTSADKSPIHLTLSGVVK